MLALRDIPNIISVGRVLLVFPTVWMLLERRFDAALWLFLIAGISDALDGFLAKRFGWQSRIGGILDPLADKFLLVSTFLSLGWLGLLPWWLVGLILLRDVVIVSGAVVSNWLIADLEAHPTCLSKTNTLLQILLALGVVLEQAAQLLPAWVIPTLILAVTLSTLASGIQYVLHWGSLARRQGRRQHHH